MFSGLCPQDNILNLSGTIAQLYLVHMLQGTLPAGFIAPCLTNQNRRTPIRLPVAAPRRLARLGSNRPFGIEKEHDHLSQARFLDRGLGGRPFDVPSNPDQDSI